MLGKIIFVLIVLFYNSCNKDDPHFFGEATNDQGEIIFLPYQWKIPLHEDGNWQSHSLSVVGNNVMGSGKILILTNENSTSRYLTLVSVATGDVLWKWNEWYQPETEWFYGQYNIVYDNEIHWVNGTRHYWVDLENGQTIKKFR